MTELVTSSDLNALEAGVSSALNRIQALLDAEAYAETLPILGNQLSGNQHVQATVQTVTRLRDSIVQAIDIVSNLGNLAEMTVSQVRSELQSRINSALTALNNSGLGFVSAANVTIDGTTGDIAISFDTGRTTAITFDAGDLGMSGLGLTLDGDVTASLGYNFDFRVGLDGSGFFLDTGNSAFSVNAGVSLGTLSADANLGFLHFNVANIADSDPAANADTLNLNLSARWGSSGLVRNFSADILDIVASGDVDLDLQLNADMGGAALPSIGAQLHVDWGFSQSLLNGNSANNSWTPATVTFDHVEYSFGSFVDDLIAPILEQLDPILGVLNEALAIVRTDISGLLLPEWAEMLDVVEPDKDEVTVLDLLQLASNAANLGVNFTPLAQLIDTVDLVVETVEFFRNRDFADAGYDVGSYTTQLQQIQGAVNALSSLNLTSSNFTGAGVDLNGFLDSIAGLAGFGDSHGDTGQTGGSIVNDILNNPLLDFPLIEDPLNVIRLLIGQDVDLFNFDMPAINIGMGMDAAGNITTPIPAFILPIWPLPVVTGNLNVAFQAVIDLAFGYDSSGLRDFAEGGFQDPLLVLGGFYFDDQRSGSTDIAEIVLRAAIEIAIDANLAVVSVGGAGNIIGEVSFDFADSLFGPDGRLYLSEITGDLFTNPFQIFDVEGRVSAGLRFYVNSVLGNLINWNSPRLTLADFTGVQGANELGPPAGLGDWFADTGQLWVNVGNRADQRDIPDRTDAGETVEISSAAGGKIVVSGFGYAQLFGADGPVTSIQIDANAGNDDIRMADSVLISARITGGAGIDLLTGGGAADQIFGGTQDDWLQGQGGSDTLSGEDGNDYLEGGAGGDLLRGGAGLDTATYVGADTGITVNFTTGVHGDDAAGDSFESIEIYEGSRKADTMTGGAGAEIFTGIEGNDTLRGMGGDDILAGGTGANTLEGGDGYDIANYFNASSGVTVAILGLAGSVTAGPVEARTINDTLTGIEQVNGSRFADTMFGHDGRQVFVGAEGDDYMHGGVGDDVLVGGLGADTMDGGVDTDIASYFDAATGVTASLATGGTGGEATGDTYESVENLRGSRYVDSLTGDEDANFLYGAEGDDTLTGGAGNDVLEGAEGGDSLIGGEGFDTASYLNAAAAVTIDLTSGQRTGVATGDSYASIEAFQGSAHDDTIRGSGASEELLGEAGADTLRGEGGIDTILGGAGIDTIYGDAGADTLYGGLDGDTIHGGTEADIVLGQEGADILHGDAGEDDLRGGSESDQLFGGEDSDKLYGNEGVDLLNGDAGDDELWGGDAGDTAYGGIGADKLWGEAGVDVLRGDSGDDTLFGGADNDTLEGGVDNDTLWGEAGLDTLRGEAGEDLLHGGAGADTFDGGADRDRVTYFDATAGVLINLSQANRNLGGTTVNARRALDGSGALDAFLVATGTLSSSVEDATGSEFADQIVASEVGSRLYGLGGDDVILGLQGSDLIEGGAGTDNLNGGDANDLLNGGTGADTLDGAGGTQDMATWEADGASVTASLLTGTATDGSGATDTLLRIEWLRGSAHGDTLTGNSVANRIEGLAGNDILDGNTGGDTLVGSTGDDIYYVDSVASATPADNDVVIESANEGDDLIRSAVNYTVALASNVEDLQLLGSVAIGTGNALNNRMIGNNAANTLDGLAGGDTYWGYGGNDTYSFDSWGDTIGLGSAPRGSIAGDGEVVGGGIDTILLATTGLTPVNTAATYSLNTSWSQQVENLVLADDDRQIHLAGNALGNLLVGNAHWQNLSGGDGDDVLDPNIGKDVVDGGVGHDTLRFDWSAVTDHAFDYSTLTGTLADGYAGVIRNWYDYGGYYRVEFTGIERFDLKLGQLNDGIAVGDGNDIVAGNGGDDTLWTGKGYDVIDGGIGTDRWIADKSDANAGMTIDLAATSTYAIAGGTGSVTGIEALGYSDASDAERFRTGSGNDLIVTRDLFLYDFLDTGAGNDTVRLYGGKDVVRMGAGNDTLLIDWSDRTDVGYNHSTISGTLSEGYSGVLRNWYDYGGYDSVNYYGVEHFIARLSQLDDGFVTGDGNDDLSGNAGNDGLYSAGGVDIIDGGTGTDYWEADKSFATAGQAIVLDLTQALQSTYLGTGTVRGIEYLNLKTGAGNDSITTLGEYLTDVLNTGAGADTVRLYGGKDNVDLGTQGVGTEDVLVVDWSAVTDYAFDYFYFVGTYADGYSGVWRNWYDYGGRHSVSFAGVERFDLTGGALGDAFRTGDGDDRTIGNAGDDWFSTGIGADVVEGGTGADRWVADKSAATTAVVIDLTSSATFSYQIGTRTGTVSGIEMLGNSTEAGDRFRTGSGNDVLTTRVENYRDFLETGDGDDLVKLQGGKDVAYMGAGFDTLVIDWSWTDVDINIASIGGTLAAGYDGAFLNNYDYDGRPRVDFTGVEKFDLKYGSGNDTVRVGDADDKVSTAAGDDSISSGLGADVIDGGLGNDRWTADKSASTQAIILDLTSSAVFSYDIGGRTGTVTGIEALGNSNDDGQRFQTGSGNDVITTRTDNFYEYIDTNDGDDRVKVQGGKDHVRMGAGFDTLVVDWSWSDVDYNVASIGGSLAAGYDGAFLNNYDYDGRGRVYFAGVEKFELTFGSGHDTVRVGDADDKVTTGLGNDWISSGLGADVIDAGAGEDRWVADKSATLQAVTLDLNSSAVFTYVIGDRTGSVTGVEMLGNSNNDGDRFNLGSGNDVVTTHLQHYSDYLDTGAGDDWVKIHGGKDLVRMGAGFDTLVADWSWSTEALNVASLNGSLAAGYDGAFLNNYDYGERPRVDFAGVEKFDLKFGSGNDVVRVGDADDKVSTGLGDDWISSGLGADVIDAGEGADRWIADKSAATQGMTIDLTSSAVLSYVIGGRTGSVTGIEALGNSNNDGDRFRSGSGNDTIVTRAEGYYDYLDTGAGNDTVKVQAGKDVVQMGTGTDRLIVDWSWSAEHFNIASLSGSLAEGYAGAFLNNYDYAERPRVDFSGVESFDISFGSGNDYAITGDGNDRLVGNAGDDAFYTNGGADTVSGGDGDDRWHADKSASTAAIVLDLSLVSSSYTIGGVTATISGVERLGWNRDTLFQTGSGNDRIITVTGDAGDYISTNAGNDLVRVAGGKDLVRMGDGVDTLVVDWTGHDVSMTVTGVYGTLAEGYFGEIRNWYNYGGYNSVDFWGVEKFDVTFGGGDDSLTTGDGDDLLKGGAGTDYLGGAGGADQIDGGAGNDTMVGGLGNDQYWVDSAGDVVTEAAGEGTDTVNAAISYTLGANVERLVLTGSAVIDGTGNALANILTGNGAANTLDGAAGADTMYGGAGDDVYLVDNAGDTANETAGNGVDTVRASVGFTLGADVENLLLTGAAAINGAGNALANVLTGNGAANRLRGLEGNDTIDGGAGADILEGGLGDDRYLVDNAADQVVELNGEGVDTVEASVSFSLAGQYADNLFLTGSAAINATGNGLDNLLRGNGAANILNGNSGADRMEGGAGDDIYVVDNAGDVVVELAGEGSDQIQSSVSTTIAANVEQLLLTGTAAINGTGDAAANRITGNGAANTLIGNAGDDRLDGGAGVDRLEGGLGNDLFVVDNAGDVVIELSGQGSDTIESSVSYTIAAGQYVETLRLTGAAANNATGNAFANTLIGNNAANILNGGAGADTMAGGLGNDTYVVDNAADVVTEVTGEGTDTIETSVTWVVAGSNSIEVVRLTGSAAINATGGTIANTLYGNSASNRLNGGGGADRMEGGLGNDIYVVDDAGDVVVEAAGAGADTVESAVDYVLGDNLEGLRLGGSALAGTGNALANTIIGNSLGNVLDGGAGADTLQGGRGDDVYYVDNVADKVIEADGEGSDLINSSVTFNLAGQYVEVLNLTGAAAINGTGNGLANRIVGNGAANILSGGDGNDRLDGGLGADRMVGGLGNDVFVVDDAADTVVENDGQGTDAIEAWISYSLVGRYVESIKLMGSGNINATGNTMANTLLGNAGNNLLNGGTGADRMEGGLGDDRFVVDNAGDVVIELNGEGYDTIESMVTFTLAGQYVDALVLSGPAAINGTGNGLANAITGNGAANVLNGGAGNDVLNGGQGADTLAGGAGLDQFWFTTALGGGNVDRIADFVAADDAIHLDRSIFTGIAADGVLASGAFRLGTAALDADDRILYDKATGNLWYDADGNGGAAAVLFATVNANTALTVADFVGVP